MNDVEHCGHPRPGSSSDEPVIGEASADHGPDCHGPDCHGPDRHGPDCHGPDCQGHRDDADVVEHRGLVKRVLLRAIGLYRMTAPVRTPRCRYIPTCSEYAAEAIESHGVGRGTWLAARRLGRCHPFGSFGFDPVPEK